MTSKEMTVASVVDNSIIVNDQIDSDKLLAKIGEKKENWDFTPDQPTHFWQPEENSVVIGIVEGKYAGEHKEYGQYECYIIRLTQPCIGLNRDGNVPEQLVEGDKISILKRHAFREFDDKIGREVVIICDGCIETKSKKSFWKVRVGVRKQ